MVKSGVSQILVNADLYLHCKIARNVVYKARKKHGKNINQNKIGQCVKRVFADKVVKRIALKNRRKNIDAAAYKSAKNHKKDFFAVFFHIRNNLSQSEEGKMLAFFLGVFHSSFSSLFFYKAGLNLVYFLIYSARRFKLVVRTLFDYSAAVEHDYFIRLA